MATRRELERLLARDVLDDGRLASRDADAAVRSEQERAEDVLGRAFAIWADLMELGEDERESELVSACSGDGELEGAVRRLMEPHPSGFLNRDVLKVADLSGDSWIGRSIHGYVIKSLLGEGGMGWVFLAAKDYEGVEIEVALKVLKGGDRGSESFTRFMLECKHMAALRHANIARLFDAGMTDEGRPYLAMEYIRGEELDKYCDGLSVKDRVRIFVKVCKAVAFAHKNLVVHRDLKPSNILVGSDGVPKLLDFGIAKSLVRGVMTTVEGRPMTPAYASPEQITYGLITVATDVYSLGVVLCRVLTMYFPYGRLDTKDLDSVMSAVLRKEALPPSKVARLYGDDDVADDMQGDLDAIVLKALEKEPGDRYGSVDALTADLERHLAGEPVSVRGDDRLYIAWKFIRKHRGGLAVAVLVAMVVLFFGGGYLVQVQKATKAGGRASLALEFLVDSLGFANPRQSLGEKLTVEEVLARSAEKARDELADQPEMRATLFVAMGRIFLSLGDMEDAEDVLLEALQIREDFGEDTGEIQYLLGEVDRYSSRFEDAEQHYRSALTSRGLDRLTRVRVQHGLGVMLVESGRDRSEARGLLNLALKELAEIDEAEVQDFVSCRKGLALLATFKGEWEEAAVRYGEILTDIEDLGVDHPDVADVKASLGIAYYWVGRLEEALALLKDALPVLRRNYGEAGNVYLVNAVYTLGNVYYGLGHGDEAEMLFREVLDHRDALPEGHIDVLSSQINMGRILSRRGEHEEAEAYLQEALELARDRLGPKSIYLESALNALGESYLEDGRWGEAENAYRESGKVTELRVGADDVRMAMTWSGLGRVAKERGDCDGAIDWLSRSVARFKEVHGDSYIHAALPLALLGECAEERGDKVGALDYFSQSLDVFQVNGYSQERQRVKEVRSHIERLQGPGR